MTVSCPRCGTRYRLPPRSQLGSDPTYRCIRCRHVFAADAAAEAPALEADAAPDEDDDDIFTFEAPPPTIHPSRRKRPRDGARRRRRGNR